MGTNYYTTKKQTHCDTCGQKLPKVDIVYDVHLGKSSAGWAFTIQANGYKLYKNWDEMKTWLKGKKIVNEYDEPVTVAQFIKLVENKKDIAEPETVDYGNLLKVIGGYKFMDCEFS